MSEYIITKRIMCDECQGTGALNLGVLGISDDMRRYQGRVTHSDCNGLGYTCELVDFDEVLLSRLEQLRWDEKWGEHTGTTKEMDNPRFEGDER